MITLSIITVNFNNVLGLQTTFDSVFKQTDTNFEYIVIDGNSTDGGKELIEKYKTKINYWVSETDNGIYDAMNKGILAAKGKYLIFMNSGDSFYHDNVIKNFSKIQNNNFGIIYGNVCLIENDTEKIFEQNYELNLDYFFKHTLNHQSAFIKKQLFDNYGLYETKYKISSDYDFFLKIFVNLPSTFFHYNDTVSVFGLDGISQNPSNWTSVINERLAIQQQHLTIAQLKLLKSKIKNNKKYAFFDLLKKYFVTRQLFNFTFFIYSKLK